MRKYFGTDGVRGIANTELTPELAFKLGRYGGHIITKNRKNPKFVVGKDTRLSGYMLESALIAGLMSVGIEVIQLGVIPTPAVAFITKSIGANGGVMISASHNPFEDNGIKFFNQDGYKLTDQTEEEIERLMDAEEDTIIRPSGAALGKITSGNQYQEIYSNHLKTTVTTSFNGLKIILDCANGASTPIAPVIFKELGAEVIAIGNEPDGININVSCGSTHPENLQARVVAENADIGLAFDGDADRLIAVDHLGNMIDGDQILYVLSKRMKKNGTLKNNTVVSTVMSNFGFKKALDAENISNVQTGVGDRYVLEEMKKNKFVIGGEQSGHIILLDYNTTGDGVLSAIQLVATLVEEEKSLNELVSSFKKYPQVLINVKVSDKRGWETNQKINDTIIKFEEKLNGNGRILVRASGTENLIRVMAEGETEDIVYEIVNGISRIVEEELNHVNERS